MSKLFSIGGKDQYRTFRETLSHGFAGPFQHAYSKLCGVNGRGPVIDDTLWALKDVSFTVHRGEVVGIIGRNGAGKSTLLKILSRITEPTAGSAQIHGRVGSLLEVGTGFHGELSGRENIYLNGAILGMRKAEIQRKFDEIVDFAEVEKFIDTPVKHYSTGMYLRLAFAVAAHLEPEILIVDEVLAVGDAEFQRKCLNKMQDAGKSGRTVLFVSHNMPAITRLCSRAILLKGGAIASDGPAHKVVAEYMSSGVGKTALREWPDPANSPAGELARLCAVRVCTEEGELAEIVDIRRGVFLEMEYDVLQSDQVLLPYFDIFNHDGICVFSTLDIDPAWRQRPRPVGRWLSRVSIPGNLLTEGMHFVAAGLHGLNPVAFQFEERDAVAFQVVDTLSSDGARGDWCGSIDGVVRPILIWTSRMKPDGLAHGEAATAGPVHAGAARCRRSLQPNRSALQRKRISGA
jgi:lipopolysaccharide transport system ATP-binding protein